MLQRGNWECSMRGTGNSRRVEGGVLFCNGLQSVHYMRGRQLPDAESEEQQFSGTMKSKADILNQVVFLEVRHEGDWI